jgi:anti-sigma factor RsiW
MRIPLRRELVCREAVALIGDYLEGRLDASQRRRLERHLRSCRNCSTYLEQMRRSIEITGEVDPGELGDDARDDLIDLFRRYRDDPAD